MVYHTVELGARVVTIGLFAAAAGAWVFLVFLLHMLMVTLIIRFPLVQELGHVWNKMNRMVQVEVSAESSARTALSLN